MDKSVIQARLGERNRLDDNGNRVPARLPDETLIGTKVSSNHIRKGIGRFYFVCYPNNTYRPSQDELKPFYDYAQKNAPKNGILIESYSVSANVSVKPTENKTK